MKNKNRILTIVTAVLGMSILLLVVGFVVQSNKIRSLEERVDSIEIAVDVLVGAERSRHNK